MVSTIPFCSGEWIDIFIVLSCVLRVTCCSNKKVGGDLWGSDLTLGRFQTLRIWTELFAKQNENFKPFLYACRSARVNVPLSCQNLFYSITSQLIATIHLGNRHSCLRIKFSNLRHKSCWRITIWISVEERIFGQSGSSRLEKWFHCTVCGFVESLLVQRFSSSPPSS